MVRNEVPLVHVIVHVTLCSVFAGSVDSEEHVLRATLRPSDAAQQPRSREASPRTMSLPRRSDRTRPTQSRSVRRVQSRTRRLL